ncbi:coiled-coil domain-containing protein [Fructobacillus pseudoficulneus]|uniref:DUF1542 domain-containing protein n=1 Tax=Fructobacillus pseudoficulneus TaxID=220714 RepID=UPI00117B9997|nr:DUF1542 domain-containing protein [Fructobacillus pseudoficulneus]
MGQDHVLAGRDLDHRMVVLADGENFYDQLDRFDRVIDYFDHSVLLDGQGQHPSQAVKSVRLVRSVDPAGHKTSREDFAIYNRPFTVYYQGEMTLADGQVIPLRPTQLKVLQKNQSVASNVDQAKTDAFQIIQNQGDYIKQIIQRLQPKLLDSDIASYGQKIDEIVVETNQKLNLADDSTAIQQVQKEQSTRLLFLQNEAGQGRDLAIAILNASRDHGYQQLEQKALEVTVAVDDAIELSPQQKLLLKKRIVTIVDNGKQQIGQATDAGQAEKALQQSIQDLQKLFLSQNSKDEALATLQQAGDEKKAGFAQIDLVDADSLVKRQQEVDRLVKRYQATVSRVKTSAELSKVLTEGLQEINRVKNPVLQAAYRPATTEDKALAKQAIATKAEAKKKDFTHLDHVDQTSLKQQLTVVDQMLSEANQGIDRSKTQGEVLHQLQDGLANIDGLANPDLQKDYRAVTEEDKQSAAKVIDQAGSDRQELLNQTQHADENSLAIQTALVEQAVSQAKLAIREAQIKKDLREAINQGQAAVYAVALPDLQRDYQMASQTSKDQAQAELRRAGLDRQTDFQQIIGVDPESLSKQSQLVDQAVAKAINAVSQADTYQNLDDAVATGLAAINQVDEPSIREELQAPSTAEIAQAKKIIEAAAALKENRFNKIAHVDGASLSQQLASIQAVVDKAHQAIDQSKTKGQVVLAMKGSLNQLTSITEPKLERAYQLVTAQDKLIANQKLAQQASAKKAAFADISHVDPISLVRQQLIVDQALTAAQRAVNQNVIQADLTEALDHGMTAIEAVTEPTVLRDFQSTTAADFEQSDQILRGAAEKKKQHFAAIVHVDATSLKEQVAVVDRLLKNSQFQVRQTKLISQFNAALQQGLVALDQVSDPILEFDYQPVTNDDREMALGMVDRIGQYKKDAIHAVNHADAASLKQQEAAVEIAISQAKEQVKQAKNQGELKKAMDDGIAQIDSVADPVIQEDFQPISQAEKDQTEGIIDDLYKGKVTDFRAIDHVDKNSLAQQLALLLQIKTNGQQALLISQNKGELAAALKKILEQMQQVAEPVKAIDYQQPNPSDVADAQRLLQVAVEKKRLSFANLIGVDPSSLAQQNQQLDQALQIAIASVALAKTNQELKDAYQNGLTVVNEVAAPVVQEPFQPVSGADREKAAKAIALIVDRQKEAFRTINHVDPSSLQKQIDQLNAIERQAQQDLAGIQVKGELNQLVLAVMDKVAVVSNPTLLANYQPVSEADKDQAIQSLTQLAAQQKRDFAAISHVDGQSLKEQNQALDQALAAGQGGIQASQNQGELNAAFLSAVQAIQLVSSPAILADFQPADEKGHWLAKQQIENALTTREQAFNQIDHVDDASLAKQVQSLNQAGQTAFDNLAKARTVGDLRLALAAGIAAILQVPNPVVQADYQPATAAEIAAGQAEIQTAADQRKQAFQAVAGVDMTELVQQEAELQKILNEGLVMAAVTPNRHDLQQVVAYYKAKIGAVTLPKALWIFRTPSADDKQAAKSQVRLASFAKHTHFDRIDGADVSSLILQRVAVNQAVQQSYNQIDQSTMNLGALAAANQVVTAIEAVADPDLFRIAEPADDTTAVAGKVVVEPAAKSLISDSTKLKDLDFDEVKVPRSQKTDASVEDQNDVTVTKIVLPETYNGQPKAVVSQVDQAVALQTDSSVKQQLPGTDHAIRGAWWRLMTVLLLSWLVVVVFGQKLYQKLQKKFQ